MPTGKSRSQALIVVATAGMTAFLTTALGSSAQAAPPEKPIAGKTVHFEHGAWSGLPQLGPDGKVRQCVMVASRPRASPSGPVDTDLSIDIGRGVGLGLAIHDERLPPADILDEQAEIGLDAHTFPAVAFTVGANNFAFHPGDAAGVLAALADSATLLIYSGGARIATGPIALDLPPEALNWLVQCGRQFAIPIDAPSDPNAWTLPAPRPREAEVVRDAPVGIDGLNDKWKIAGWDASELRDSDGKVVACVIRQHYTMGAGKGAERGSQRVLGTFLIATRAKGLAAMIKDSALNLTPGSVDVSLKIDGKSLAGLSGQISSKDEILLFPQHGAGLAAALGDGVSVAFDASGIENFQFAVPSGVVPWLRACTNRWDIGFEPG